MVFASCRFDDTKNICEVSFKKGAVAGSCLPTRNLKQPFYCVFPISGFISNGAWFDIIADVRTRYHSCHGVPMNFLFAHTKEWKFDDMVYPSATYGPALRTIRLFLAKAGYAKANHTLHPPRNAFNTFAAQLGWTRADRATIGRWAPRSQMPTAYDRSKCVTELRLRNDVAQRIKSGRIPSCDFDLPFSNPRKTDAVGPDAEETDTSNLWSSGAKDEAEIEQTTTDLDDSDNKVTGYAESV